MVRVTGQDINAHRASLAMSSVVTYIPHNGQIMRTTSSCIGQADSPCVVIEKGNDSGHLQYIVHLF